MNEFERKNIWFRIISSFVLICSLGLSIYFIVRLFMLKPEDIALYLAADFILCFLTIFETIFLLKNIKNDLIINTLVFNHNKKVNRPMVVITSIGLAIGIGLLTFGLIALNTNDNILFQVASVVGIPIAAYLVINCAIYFSYLLLYKEKPLKLEDLLK